MTEICISHRRFVEFNKEIPKLKAKKEEKKLFSLQFAFYKRNFHICPLHFLIKLLSVGKQELYKSERRRMTFAINYSGAFNSLRGGTSYPII